MEKTVLTHHQQPPLFLIVKQSSVSRGLEPVALSVANYLLGIIYLLS